MTIERGLFGKLPARGDFVRIGLPRSFCSPWDAWWQRNLASVVADHPDDWTPMWLEAPVWRFFLGADICGPDPVLGVFLPSVDRAGRYFPLTVAALPASGWDSTFLDLAEEAGRGAIATDTEPDAVIAQLPPVRPGAAIPASACIFETAGAPRVAPVRFELAVLPEGPAFAALFDDAVPVHPRPTEAVP